MSNLPFGQPHPPQPEPGPSPSVGLRRSRRRTAAWVAAVVVAFMLGIVVGGAAVGTAPAERSSAAGDLTSAIDTTEGLPDVVETTSEEPLPAIPEPDNEFSFTCDYVLGDFTENSKSGYRFLADAELDNTGNIGTVTKITATWYLGGGDKIVKSKTVKVPTGAAGQRVGFTVPATQDQIDRHQSLDGDNTCKVEATLTDTFGDPE